MNIYRKVAKIRQKVSMKCRAFKEQQNWWIEWTSKESNYCKRKEKRLLFL